MSVHASRDVGGFGYDSTLRGWVAPFYCAGHDSKLVHRSNALLKHMYGTNLHYKEVIPFNGKVLGCILAAVATAATKLLAFLFYVPITRHVLMKCLPTPGQGPSKDVRDKGYFWVSSTSSTC
jgi:short subunit dehydrogenase-like uncharacterized protein